MTDHPRGAVLVFDSGGKFLREWGSGSTGYAQLVNSPGDLAIDPLGRVIVAEAWSYRLHFFDAHGNVLATWGETGDGPGQFIYPYGITMAPDGFASDYFPPIFRCTCPARA